MKNFVIRSSLVVALAVSAAGAHASQVGETLEGKVVKIADGDTLTLLLPDRTQHRIRLAEIDAPESGQAFGRQSKNALTRLCAQRNASVLVNDTDRYGRIIGRVICDGIDTTVEQVSTGMAWVYDSYVHDRGLYALQDQAKADRVGLWFDENPIPPWEWRKNPTSTQDSSLNTQIRTAYIYGNPNSNIYHIRDRCAGYKAMNPKYAVPFNTEAEAKAAGFRKAANCK